MNERIKELAERCWTHTNEPLYSERSPHWEFDRNKFAELIVRECIKIVEDVPPGYQDYRNQIEDSFRSYCIDSIKASFGIDQNTLPK